MSKAIPSANTFENLKHLSLNEILKDTFKSYYNLPALSDLEGATYSYKETGEEIAKLHIIFESAELKAGDKVAICGKNSANWMIVFLGCLTYGLTAVPILHEFNSSSVTTLVNHSEAKLLFADKSIIDQLNENDLPDLLAAFYITERGLSFCRREKIAKARKEIDEIFIKKFGKNFEVDDIKFANVDPEDIVLINYTSGSTGTPKGVMLPERSLRSNIIYCITHLTFLLPGDGMVNMLPLGHMYGMIIESLHPFVKGVCSNFISKVPSPRVLLSAFAKVRPKLIITVPLVLEKIIKNNVFPLLKKPKMKFLLSLPLINKLIYKKIKKKLISLFGGQLVEVIIGGAPLNPDVESFLYKIHFPVTVGYGMTECGPLISYCPSSESRPHTVGRIVDGMEIKIDSKDPEKIPGEIWVRGENVMKGYYKNPQATEEAFSPGNDWMNTGDMGTISKDGQITISGRSKTMILGPSGQNIYPEDIEQQLNNLPLVEESLVIEENGKLIALIFPNLEESEKQGLKDASLLKFMEQGVFELNKQLESFSRLSGIRLMEKEFEKTPKRSIKRFLYQH